MSSEPVRYAAPGVPFGDHQYLVFDSIAPEAPYVFRSGPLGEHARWMLKMRHKYEWKNWPTWRQLFTNQAWAWRPTNLTIIRVEWWHTALAWALTAYAVGSILTRARKG